VQAITPRRDERATPRRRDRRSAIEALRSGPIRSFCGRQRTDGEAMSVLTGWHEVCTLGVLTPLEGSPCAGAARIDAPASGPGSNWLSVLQDNLTMKNLPNTDGRDTLTLLQRPAKLPLIIEAREDHVLVVCGPYGGKGRTVADALDALARRMGRRSL